MTESVGSKKVANASSHQSDIIAVLVYLAETTVTEMMLARNRGLFHHKKITNCLTGAARSGRAAVALSTGGSEGKHPH